MTVGFALSSTAALLREDDTWREFTAAEPIGKRAMASFFSDLWTGVLARFDGPLHFRLIVQPLMAMLFAVRDGSRDSREARSPYLWSLVTDPTQRRYLLESGWKGISKVFVLALALDVVYQLMEWGTVKVLKALLAAIVLAVIPYALLRGPVHRVMLGLRPRR